MTRGILLQLVNIIQVLVCRVCICSKDYDPWGTSYAGSSRVLQTLLLAVKLLKSGASMSIKV